MIWGEATWPNTTAVGGSRREGSQRCWEETAKAQGAGAGTSMAAVTAGIKHLNISPLPSGPFPGSALEVWGDFSAFS